jgi:hypothetical protein
MTKFPSLSLSGSWPRPKTKKVVFSFPFIVILVRARQRLLYASGAKRAFIVIGIHTQVQCKDSEVWTVPTSPA